MGTVITISAYGIQSHTDNQQKGTAIRYRANVTDDIAAMIDVTSEFTDTFLNITQTLVGYSLEHGEDVLTIQTTNKHGHEQIRICGHRACLKLIKPLIANC